MVVRGRTLQNRILRLQGPHTRTERQTPTSGLGFTFHHRHSLRFITHECYDFANSTTHTLVTSLQGARHVLARSYLVHPRVDHRGEDFAVGIGNKRTKMQLEVTLLHPRSSTRPHYAALAARRSCDPQHDVPQDKITVTLPEAHFQRATTIELQGQDDIALLQQSWLPH